MGSNGTAWFIILKGSKFSCFFTNDLAHTQSADIISGYDDEAATCVQGLVEVRRWVGDDVLYRRNVLVTAIIG